MKQVRRHSGMSDEDVASVAVPTALEPDLQATAVRLITRAEAMGLIASDDLLTLSRSSLMAALDAFFRAGIGRLLTKPTEADQDLRSALDLMNIVVENSPSPDTEWESLQRTLPLEVLTKLLGISESSVRRYANQGRPTPQDVAVRLHWLAMRVADLTGAYNRFGILRWFDRPRRALNGQSPAQRLSGTWSPDDHSVIEVADLAASLTAMSAT